MRPLTLVVMAATAVHLPLLEAPLPTLEAVAVARQVPQHLVEQVAAVQVAIALARALQARLILAVVEAVADRQVAPVAALAVQASSSSPIPHSKPLS